MCGRTRTTCTVCLVKCLVLVRGHQRIIGPLQFRRFPVIRVGVRLRSPRKSRDTWSQHCIAGTVVEPVWYMPLRCRISSRIIDKPWRSLTISEPATTQMAHRMIPKPRQPPRTDERVKPNLLFPLQEPPQPLEYPALPCPPRDHRFTSTYTVSTHLIPAAFPRVTPFVPLPPVPEHESKDERSARVKRYVNEFIAFQTQHAPDKSEPQPTVLWTVLNRYVRTDCGTGLTLLLLHANGLHKEVSISVFLPTASVTTMVDLRADITPSI
jgi:hypothetical protein